MFPVFLTGSSDPHSNFPKIKFHATVLFHFMLYEEPASYPSKRYTTPNFLEKKVYVYSIKLKSKIHFSNSIKTYFSVPLKLNHHSVPCTGFSCPVNKIIYLNKKVCL
jgi:hypothetical protein